MGPTAGPSTGSATLPSPWPESSLSVSPSPWYLLNSRSFLSLSGFNLSFWFVERARSDLFAETEMMRCLKFWNRFRVFFGLSQRTISELVLLGV